MIGSDAPIVLDLRTLPEQCELFRQMAETLAAGASVVLERLQGTGEHDAARVHRGGEALPAVIIRVPVDDAARRSYDDAEEATEEGAEAIAILRQLA